MFKKTMAALLVLVMVGLSLAGCTTTGGSKASSEASVAPSSTATSSTVEGDVGVEAAEFTYPMDGTETLSWWVGTGFELNTAFASAADSPFHTELSKQVGVDIEWLFLTAGSDANQARNLLLASGNLPDIMYANELIVNAERFIAEGVLRDLTDDMAKNSPAYYKHLTSNPLYDKSMKTDAGQYYGYGFFREDGGWNDSYQGPVIRKDWLDELGLEAPKTISEWETVMRAFKEKKGSALAFAWDPRFKATGIAGAFGAYATSDFLMYVDPDGKVQYPFAQEGWRDYMGKLNEWWKEGLLDQDSLTMKDVDMRTKAMTDAAGISYTSMGQLSSWEQDAQEQATGAEWIGLQYPTSDDGKLSMVFGGSGVGTAMGVITTNCPDEKLETAMRVLDYAYTDAGNLYWNYGTEGVSWEYGADGEVNYLPLVTDDPDGLNQAISKYGGSTWSGSCVQATRMLHLKNTPAAIAANDLWFYPNEAVSNTKIPPHLTFTEDESNRIDELKNAIETTSKEVGMRYITGEESIDTFDSYVENLNSMGLEEMVQIYQDAYDRYNAR